MPEKFGPDEHEALLAYLDTMHNETREQTLTRLRAALGEAGKAGVAERREVAKVKARKVARSDKAAAKKAKAERENPVTDPARWGNPPEPVNKQVLSGKRVKRAG